MEISKSDALEILQDNNIEMSSLDTRSPELYVMELLVYIEAVKIDIDEKRQIINERYKSNQSTSPYFA